MAAFAFSVFILSVLVLIWLSHKLLSSTEKLLLPLCNNFIAITFVPFCQRVGGNANTHPPPPPPAHYTELVELQSRLENVMDLAGDGTLSWAVRSSEVAMRDLTMEVRLSDLVSKDTFVDKLLSFTHEAKDTARLLQRLSSRVGGAVDTCVFYLHHLGTYLKAIP
jgi:hypothetical protein